ncbi:membrane protein insertase YidC [Nostocoides sp. Soil756]|jgi:YidC/Oxa1 family membrane protein insertase|uniref:membrane protein insertase YidC n=1 Tax=Nostocoides sp. Soil756 TaxID=1736399 RepID=UPI0009EBBA08|nr:membrane protein insertase YidC [Tetrasphaera sp. Soil756]
MGDLFNSILAPIEWLVAWIMYSFHQALTAIGMPEASGWTWGLSIVGLVIVMRAAMIPLFVKQIKASRKLQLIQPEMQKIQKKYKGKNDPESRQAMTQETMDLYKKEGTNPFSSCLPILVQSPFFFGLFRVLNGLQKISTGETDPIGPITKQVASQAERASIFGAQLSDHFLGADRLSTQIVTIVLIVLMSATTFTTQRQLMTKNMPQSALDSPFAKQQKMLLYVFPLVFAVSGVNFPIGVLIYWFTTNVWSMTQQFYVIRRMPAPGSAAERAYHERLKKKGKAIPGAAVATGAEAVEVDETPAGQRVQPKSKKRAKGSGKTAGATAAGSKPAAGTPASAKDASGNRSGKTSGGSSTAGAGKPGAKKTSAGKSKKSGQGSPSAG